MSPQVVKAIRRAIQCSTIQHPFLPQAEYYLSFCQQVEGDTSAYMYKIHAYGWGENKLLQLLGDVKLDPDIWCVILKPFYF